MRKRREEKDKLKEKMRRREYVIGTQKKSVQCLSGSFSMFFVYVSVKIRKLLVRIRVRVRVGVRVGSVRRRGRVKVGSILPRVGQRKGTWDGLG